MPYLIWAGALISMVGLAGIVLSMVRVMRARRAGLSDADLRVRIAAILPLNLGALFVSVIGLMCVIVGILLG